MENIRYIASLCLYPYYEAIKLCFFFFQILGKNIQISEDGSHEIDNLVISLILAKINSWYNLVLLIHCTEIPGRIITNQNVR